MQSYQNGIITGTPAECPNSESNHAVLITGYNNLNNPPFWIVKNSWGLDWGYQGYFMIESNDNDFCGINSCVTTALL